MTLYFAIVLAVAFICTAVFGRIFIPVLMTKKLGQERCSHFIVLKLF